MANPQQISFDDDIMIILKGFIKKSQRVTQVQWEIYQQFPKVLEKQKYQFSNMLDTINYYCQYGKQEMTQSPIFIE